MKRRKDSARDAEATDGAVKRRTVLRGLATGFAGAVAVPSASSFAAVTETTTPLSPEQAQSVGGSDASQPRLLSEQELETLVSLSEHLVPGSAAAGVPDLVDRVAAVDTTEGQRELLTALRAFEGEARTAHASRWVELDESVQVGMLEEAVAGSRPALHDSLVHLRDVVARTFFATEPGMRRLGWTPRLAWRELPGCDPAPDNDD